MAITALLNTPPANVPVLLSKLPVIAGETEEQFKARCFAWLEELKPTGLAQHDFAMDVILASWELARWRRLKNSLLETKRREAVEQLLIEFGDPDVSKKAAAEAVSRKWAAREKQSCDKVRDLLEQNGLDLDSIMAKALSLVIDDVERLESLIAGCEQRRDRALNQLQKTKRARQQIEGPDSDAEFELVNGQGEGE